ncbi:DUF932 domain-containing protein [Streptomyces sp. NBC_00233]|uniref:DUF932 domain-containing protein n=1 Tax=Streptomyces sp. NBC_00233 TaxID=2975686 RepID=UPI00338DE126
MRSSRIERTRRRNNQLTRWNTIRNLLEYADTQAAIRGTAWAGCNAITEYADHVVRPVGPPRS